MIKRAGTAFSKSSQFSMPTKTSSKSKLSQRRTRSIKSGKGLWRVNSDLFCCKNQTGMSMRIARWRLGHGPQPIVQGIKNQKATDMMIPSTLEYVLRKSLKKLMTNTGLNYHHRKSQFQKQMMMSSYRLISLKSVTFSSEMCVTLQEGEMKFIIGTSFAMERLILKCSV